MGIHSPMVVSLDSFERGTACKTYLVSCDLYFRIYISRNLCRFIFENQSEFGEFLGIAKFCCTASKVVQNSRTLQEVQPNLSVFRDFYSFDCNLP